jgi:hypothetical protein
MVRVLPMSRRVRTLLEHHLALRKESPVKKRRVQGIVEEVSNRARRQPDASRRSRKCPLARLTVGRSDVEGIR